jgi:hypothetical protein
VVSVAQGRARTDAHNVLTSCPLLTLTRRTRNSRSHLELSHDSEYSSNDAGPSTVSGWRVCRGTLVETRVRHCSLVVLDDTEARYLRPLLTVQPSSRFRIRSFS